MNEYAVLEHDGFTDFILVCVTENMFKSKPQDGGRSLPPLPEKQRFINYINVNILHDGKKCVKLMSLVN